MAALFHCRTTNEVTSSDYKCNSNEWKGGYGNTIILLHKTMSGEHVTSFYGHLMDYDCGNSVQDKDCNSSNSSSEYQNFNEGDTVDIDKPIGKVGATKSGAYHLHFEIRKESLLTGDGTKLELKYYPGMWPASMKKDNNGKWVKGTSSDNGKTFIDENYYDPSNFIKEHSADVTAPIISSLSANNITSSTATIIWTTNESATSQVEYGTTTAYGSSTSLSSTLITGHSQTLSGLQASTTYHFRVKSSDASGNLANSGDNIFTTLPITDTTPPAVSTTSRQMVQLVSQLTAQFLPHFQK